MFAITAFAAALLLHAAGAADDIALENLPALKLQWKKNITVPKAGYAFLPSEFPKGTLMVTGFNAAPIFGKGGIYLGSVLSDEDPVQLTDAVDWPNEVTVAPKNMFGETDFPAVVVGAGFLVPTHPTGGVWVLEASTDPAVLKDGPVKITTDLGGWFYHVGEFLDMNGDGHLDIVTARCFYTVYPWESSKRKGKLVWLENPGSGALNGTAWTEHELTDGPDFLFTVQPDSGKDDAPMLAIAAAEYLKEKVSYYWYDGEKMNERVIDADSGPGFACEWVDLNGDGELDLLATNHLNTNGSVYAYTFDGDLRDANTQITKYVLATGFSAITDASGTAAPGVAVPFQPTPNDPSKKPAIFVSADNGNYVSLLTPASQDADDWSYNLQYLADVGADVGGIAIDDVDSNGYSDILIPAYDLGWIVHYEMAPAK